MTVSFRPTDNNSCINGGLIALPAIFIELHNRKKGRVLGSPRRRLNGGWLRQCSVSWQIVPMLPRCFRRNAAKAERAAARFNEKT
jgi:hypothetical protein